MFIIVWPGGSGAGRTGDMELLVPLYATGSENDTGQQTVRSNGRAENGIKRKFND